MKSNFFEVINTVNKKLEKGEEPIGGGGRKILSQVNSYLGAMSHTNSYKLRKSFLSRLDWRFWGHFKTTEGLSKIVLKKKRKKRKKNRLSQEKRKKKRRKKQKSVRGINVMLSYLNK